MPLSESALNEIRAELANLHQFKIRLDERIKALEGILAPLDMGQALLPLALHSNNGGALRPHKIHDAILEVMRERGSARSTEVVQLLKSRGFVNEGKTPLTTRVYNELWRMSKKGKITAKDGVFSVK